MVCWLWKNCLLSRWGCRLRLADESEQASLLYHGRYFGRNVLFPSILVVFDHLQHFVGLDLQVSLFVVPDIFYFIVGDQVAVEIYEVGRRIEAKAIIDDAVA